MQKYKTIGMLSEQEGESKHASVNAELRSLTCVRSHSERNRLVLEKDELCSHIDKSLIKPKPRICPNCPRTYLRAGNDGKKHCNFCDTGYFI